MNRSKRERVEKLLKEEKEILSIMSLERKLNFSRGVISKFYNNNRKLKRNEITIIDDYIQSIIAKYFE